VEGHAAIPQFEDVQRVPQDFGLVEKDIGEPSADDDAKRRIEDHVVRMTARHG
jgi:hypothetical protein